MISSSFFSYVFLCPKRAYLLAKPCRVSTTSHHVIHLLFRLKYEVTCHQEHFTNTPLLALLTSLPNATTVEPRHNGSQSVAGGFQKFLQVLLILLVLFKFFNGVIHLFTDPNCEGYLYLITRARDVH